VTAAEDEFYKVMGERIARLRRRQGISQLELGRRLGLSRPAVSNIESGQSGTTAYRLNLICRILGCSPDDLMPGRPQLAAETPVTVVMTVGGRSARFQHTF
jgi:transcriptional regulator with XRE-family HTH domain